VICRRWLQAVQRKKLTNVCLYELSRWKDILLCMGVYVLYASWTGCAALGGLEAIDDRERSGLYQKRICLLSTRPSPHRSYRPHQNDVHCQNRHGKLDTGWHARRILAEIIRKIHLMKISLCTCNVTCMCNVEALQTLTLFSRHDFCK
jgi:hypothetical protein